MAQRKTALRGNAGNAPKAVDLNMHPDREHLADLHAYFLGRRDVTICAKRGFLAQAYRPGEDLDGVADHVTLMPGDIARLPVEPPPGYNQNAATLAHMAARGHFHIVDEKGFTEARDHSEVVAERKAKARETKDENNALREENAVLRAQLAGSKK